MYNWKTWVYGLISAFIGGGANAITVMIVEPLTFNLEAGMSKLLTVFFVSGLVSASFYLKSSPLPPKEESDSSKSSSILMVLILFLSLSGCAGTLDAVANASRLATPLLEPSFKLAASQVISHAISAEDKQAKINLIFASAQAIRTLSGGKVTSQAVKDVLDIWLPSKSHWSTYADVVSSFYESNFNKLAEDPKAIAAALEKIALGIEQAAQEAK